MVVDLQSIEDKIKAESISHENSHLILEEKSMTLYSH